MQEVKREYDNWGKVVIYVLKCKNFKWENPEEPPIKLKKYKELCKPILREEKKYGKIVIR